MSTNVQPAKQAEKPEPKRPSHANEVAPEHAFDAALAAQWMLNAQTLRSSPASARVLHGTTRAIEANASARSDAAQRGGICGERSGRDQSDGASATAARRTPNMQGLTELSSKELAGQLPSRKEMLRNTEGADGDRVAAPEPGRSSPAERGRSPRATPLESPRAPTEHAPAAATMTPASSVARPRPGAKPDGARAPDDRAKVSPVVPSRSSAAGLRVGAAVGAGQVSPSVRAVSMTSAAEPVRVTGVGDPLARARSAGPSIRSPKAAQLATSKPALEPEHPVAAQALRGLAAALRQGSGSVTLHLAPENLGRLRLSIAVKPSEVVARVEATSEEAAQALRENSSQLREALEAQGFAISCLEVDHVSPALLQLRNRSTMDQHAAPQQWGGDAQSGQQGHASAHGDARRESPIAPLPGTPLAVEPVIEQAFVSAHGVNAIA